MAFTTVNNGEPVIQAEAEALAGQKLLTNMDEATRKRFMAKLTTKEMEDEAAKALPYLLHIMDAYQEAQEEANQGGEEE